MESKNINSDSDKIKTDIKNDEKIVIDVNKEKIESDTRDNNQNNADIKDNKEVNDLYVLIEETYKNDQIKNIENTSEEKEITEEEYLLECSRYNDLEGVNDVLECGVVKLDYQNETTKNSALRKYTN